jgi:hypothetical protein
MKSFALWRSASIAILGIALAVTVSCKFRNFNSSAVKKVDTAKLQSDGIVLVDWKCSGTKTPNIQGLNSQEEYCEWTRAPELLGGREVCMFTTAFDGSRHYHLTKFQPLPPQKTAQTNHNFYATQFNTYAFLRGGTQPDDNQFKPGIIAHCSKGNPCTSPACVSSRASDPQICKGLNFLSRKGCNIEVDFQVAPLVTAGDIPPGKHGDQPVKLQLIPSELASKYCRYHLDPVLQKKKPHAVNPSEERTLLVCDLEQSRKGSCDGIADEITVLTTLKVTNPECDGGTPNSGGGPGISVGATCSIIPAKNEQDKELSNVRSTPKVTSPEEPTNIVDKLPHGFGGLFIRGIVGEFVSVSYTHNNEMFGAPARPSFLHITQLDSKSCKK